MSGLSISFRCYRIPIIKFREVKMTDAQCTNDLIVALIPLIAAITFAVNALVAWFQTRIITNRLEAMKSVK